jgi:hypothetical protein
MSNHNDRFRISVAGAGGAVCAGGDAAPLYRFNERKRAAKTGIEPITTRVIVVAANHFTVSPWATPIQEDSPRGIVPRKRSKVVMMPPIVTTR